MMPCIRQREYIYTWKGFFQMPYENVVATFATGLVWFSEMPYLEGTTKFEGC